MKWPIPAASAFVGMCALLYTYNAGQPTIEFDTMRLAQPFVAGAPVLSEASLKNYGSTAAHHLRVSMSYQINYPDTKVDLNSKGFVGGEKTGDWSMVDTSDMDVDLPQGAFYILKQRPPVLMVNDPNFR
jgi:hypothetical protein